MTTLTFLDAAQESTATTGTSDFALGGAIDSTSNTFSTAGNGSVVPYFAFTTTQREVGYGTYVSSGNTLQRTTILWSTSASAKVNFASPPTICSDIPAAVANAFLANGVTGTGAVVLATSPTFASAGTVTMPDTSTWTSSGLIGAAGLNITSGAGFVAGASNVFKWAGRAGLASPADAAFALTNNAGSVNTYLSIPGNASLQLGAADVAGSPVAQTLQVQSAAGVLNTNGANTTINLSAGTGTGTGGNLVIQGAPHSTTGSTKNAYSTLLTINGDTGQLQSNSNIIAGAAQALMWSSRSIMTSPADGQFKITNNAGSTTLFDFGATTALVLTVAGGLTYGGVVAAAFGTTGVSLIGITYTQTDSTTAAGTVTNVYGSLVGANTLATAANAITITNAFNVYVQAPAAGAHVTLTNAYALGADNIYTPNLVYAGGVQVAHTSSVAATTGIYSFNNSQVSIVAASVEICRAYGQGMNMAGSLFFGWSSGSPSGTATDTALFRNSAGVVGVSTSATLNTSGGLILGTISAAGSLTFTTATAGIVLKQGANGLCGTFVANGATPVAISNTNVAITDSIIISLNTVGGTVGVQPHVSAITAGSGFSVTCTAVDTSTYNYAIIKNAA